MRTKLYQYDFFDGTNRAGLVFQYLMGDFRKDWVRLFEDNFARVVGVNHAVAFGAGRMALYAILEALDIGEGDEVIVPGYTCVVVPNAILYRGAKPLYVDISRTTFNIQAELIEKAITPNTRAIIAQHTFGQPCDIEAILSIARRHQLKVIEDCAHALGASYGSKTLGTFGDAAFTSTDHTKIISTSVGGVAFTSSPELARGIRKIQERAPCLSLFCRTRIITQYALLSLLTRPSIYWLGRMMIAAMNKLRLTFYFRDEGKTVRPRAYPVKMSEFQAYVGCQEIARLADNVRHRRHVAKWYQEVFCKAGGLPEGAFLRYSFLVQDPKKWERTLGKYFVIGRWFSSITHGRSAGWDEINYRSGSCPTAEEVAAHIINFPTHYYIDDTAIQRLRVLIEKSELKSEILAT